MRGLCIDPTWAGGTPDDKTARLYWRLRYVLFSSSWPATRDYINAGWYPHGVVARESGDPTFFNDWGPPNFDVTIGNEPDTSGAASWTMTPAQYGQLWQATSNYQVPRWIGGFASGDVAKAHSYLKYAPGAAGIDVHLYTLSPDDAAQRVREYQSLGLPVRVGEWHPADGYRLSDYVFDVDDNVFCFSDAMVAGMGIYA